MVFETRYQQKWLKWKIWKWGQKWAQAPWPWSHWRVYDESGRAHMCIGWLIGNNTGSQTITYCQNSPRWAHIHTSIQADNGRLSIYKRCHIWGQTARNPNFTAFFSEFHNHTAALFWGSYAQEHCNYTVSDNSILGQFLPPFENIVSLCFLPFD